MQLLLEIDNPDKLKILTDLLDELQFVRHVKIVDSEQGNKAIQESREQSLALIMRGCDLPSFGDGLSFQKSVRTDRTLPFREN